MFHSDSARLSEKALFPIQVEDVVNVPGPLTLRMIERVWSSMNSTRTWVTPPREPIIQEELISLYSARTIATAVDRDIPAGTEA
jgi:hypothetical protein